MILNRRANRRPIQNKAIAGSKQGKTTSTPPDKKINCSLKEIAGGISSNSTGFIEGVGGAPAGGGGSALGWGGSGRRGGRGWGFGGQFQG